MTETFVDLGVMPLCESYVSAERLDQPEPRYPLHAWVCRVCMLVQLEALATPREIFDEYAYFSSYADSWVEHARRYAAHVTARFSLAPADRVIEVASNDGYLLQHFVARGHDVLGIEPAINVAAMACERGIPTETAYLGADAAADLVRRGCRADLLVANNVLAHVPDLHDFIEGLRMLLAPRGVLTIEIPHLQSLIDRSQFDTIYHEHFSYFSLLTAERALDAHGLSIFDVEMLPTHGGSLRIYAQHRESGRQEPAAAVETIRARERAAGLDRLEAYRDFGRRAEAVRAQLLAFLHDARLRGKRVVGYGAPGKGNTLLNYCGIGPDLLPFTVDRNPYKQGKYTPGTHVPIRHPDAIAEARPDYLLVLPWNLKDEIIEQMAGIRTWGGAFVVPIPHVDIVP